MPLAGQPFGLYCTQAPPNANGILIAFTGDGLPSIQQVQSGPEGYVETSVGNLPNTPGKLSATATPSATLRAVPAPG